MKTLYHTSPEQVSEIKNEGVFGGVFASSSQAAALSHHNFLHTVELDDSEILTNYELNYNLNTDDVMNALKDVLWAKALPHIERIFELTVEEKNIEESDCEILGVDDIGSASWEAQRIRGAIAKKLGYKAIEMDDEHGVSYLVLPGAAINYAS